MGNGMELRRPGNRRPVHQVREPSSQQHSECKDWLRETEKCANVNEQKYQEVMYQLQFTISAR